MKTNTTLIGEAAQWLESFEFIGTVFPVRGKKTTLDSSNIKYVVMCNTKGSSKSIQQVSYQEFLAYEKSMLIIQMGNDPKKLIEKKSCSSISDRILIELAFGTPLDDHTFNDVMTKNLGINYKSVFSCSSMNDFNQVIAYKEKQNLILRLIDEAFAMIYEHGLTYDLMLQTKVYPIYQEIFRNGFLIDVKAMQNEYKKIEYENEIMLQYFIDRYSVNPDNLASQEHLDNAALQVLHRYRKNKLMLSRYPKNKLIRMKNGKKSPYLMCSYKQIGTRTLRISTSQVNIYGLPKRLRQHLIPNDGKVLVEADFHASELLIIANLACEGWLINAYQQGKDIYKIFAARFFHKAIKDIQLNERKAMKRLFFAFINGAKNSTLHDIISSLDIVISSEDMSIGLQCLKRKIPNIITYIESLKYKSNVMTPTGRWWSEDDLPESKKRASYIIQIVESEILFNTVMLVQREVLQYEGMRIYLTKHDSITIESPVEYVNKAKSILTNNMTKAVQIFFDMQRVHINIEVTPSIEEKEIMIMKTNTIKQTKVNNRLGQFNIATLNNIKQQLSAQKKKTVISTVSPEPEEEYLAIVKDVTYDKDKNIVKVVFVVFIGDKTFTYQSRYSLDTNAAYYYDLIVQLLGDEDGNIIGSMCYVVFHRNERFLNIEVLEAADEEELGVEASQVEVPISKKNADTRSNNRMQRAKNLVEPDNEDDFEDENDDYCEFNDEEVEE